MTNIKNKKAKKNKKQKKKQKSKKTLFLFKLIHFINRILYLFTMPKIAWAKKLYNAYNCLNINDKVFSEQGVLAGTATTWKARPTQNSPKECST